MSTPPRLDEEELHLDLLNIVRSLILTPRQWLNETRKFWKYILTSKKVSNWNQRAVMVDQFYWWPWLVASFCPCPFQHEQLLPSQGRFYVFIPWFMFGGKNASWVPCVTSEPDLWRPCSLLHFAGFSCFHLDLCLSSDIPPDWSAAIRLYIYFSKSRRWLTY